MAHNATIWYGSVTQMSRSRIWSVVKCSKLSLSPNAMLSILLSALGQPGHNINNSNGITVLLSISDRPLKEIAAAECDMQQRKIVKTNGTHPSSAVTTSIWCPCG